MTHLRDGLPPLGPGDSHIAAQMFQPERLTLARELRGLSKVQLSDRVQKTPSAISQFETGRTRPDAATLDKLALGLEVRLGFFARPGSAPLIATDNCHFRSLRSASQRDRRSLLAVGTLLCDLVNLLEEHVSFPREQVTSVAASAQSADAIEQVAVDVRRKWGLGLGPIPAIVKLLEAKGVIVTRVPDSCAQVDAFSVWNDHRPLVFLVTGKGSHSRARFDAAHELGHLVLHADVSAASPDAEREANRFASAFLLPRESFLRECPTVLNWDHLYELKRRWRVSVAAIVKRCFDLGRLSEASYRRAFVHLNQSGERQRESREEPPPDHPVLVRNAVDIVSREFPLPVLCEYLGLFQPDLQRLLSHVAHDGDSAPTDPAFRSVSTPVEAPFDATKTGGSLTTLPGEHSDTSADDE